MQMFRGALISHSKHWLNNFPHWLLISLSYHICDNSPSLRLVCKIEMISRCNDAFTISIHSLHVVLWYVLLYLYIAVRVQASWKQVEQ